jgi:L-fuconolactonase
MTRIDAHQHFWKFDPIKDSWINDEMKILQTDFMPADLLPLLQKHNVDGCIAVQAHESETENDFLLQLAKENDFIKGIVGWIDFMDKNLEQRLIHYNDEKLMKGFRYMLQGYDERALMLHPTFQKNIGLLQKYNFTYDLLIHSDQLIHTLKLAQNFPDQPFIIDHIAKPDIKNKSSHNWLKDITALTSTKNVYCKLSGMTTEADLNSWKKEDIFPFIDTVVNAFGTKRLLFGSDWPVCILAGSYSKTLDVVEDYFQSFSIDEQADIMGRNAIQFYNLHQ